MGLMYLLCCLEGTRGDDRRPIEPICSLVDHHALVLGTRPCNLTARQLGLAPSLGQQRQVV